VSSAHKEHIKSLKGPDQFQIKAMAFLDWGVKNVRVLAIAMAPVALIVAGVFAVRFVQQKRKDARVDELGKVQVVFDAEARQAGDARHAVQKQIEDVEAEIAKTAPPAAKDGKAPPPAVKVDNAALTAKKDALLKQIAAIKPDHTESAAKFLAYFKAHDTFPEGWLAGMEAARVATEQEKFADARGLLEGIVAKAKTNAFYTTQARFALIGVLEELGDYDKGLAEAAELEKSVEADLKPKVLLAKGRLQMLKNAKADAKATFGAIIENHATSPEAQKARSLSALLN
jgi:predicted negative regulator of RcsB-dependent stress response